MGRPDVRRRHVRGSRSPKQGQFHRPAAPSLQMPASFDVVDEEYVIDMKNLLGFAGEATAAPDTGELPRREFFADSSIRRTLLQLNGPPLFGRAA